MRNSISKFITAICEKNYSQADSLLKDILTEKVKQKVKKIKGNDDMNYFMLFSEVEGIGLDELLNYVKKTIDVNIEREKKHDLLRIKVNELKEVFKKRVA